jgi:hypothetical protein
MLGVEFSHCLMFPRDGRGQMVSKCSNPRCSNPFRYLHEGKLFRMAVTSGATFEVDPGTKKSSSHIEFFWLCEECAPEMTLTFKHGIGVTTQPVSRAQAAEAS